MAKKVAIIGGGMGGLAAAFELVTKAPGEFEITVFERDFKLGGKGASGRNLQQDLGKRIEEHGLHVLMGFYDNVFEILARCYGDLRAAGKLPKEKPGEPWWAGVLHGLDEIFFSEPPLPGSEEWILWNVGFGANGMAIGGPARTLPTVKELMVGAMQRFAQRALSDQRLALDPDVEVQKALRRVNVDSTARFEQRTDSLERRELLEGSIKTILKVALRILNLNPTDERVHKWFVALYFAGVGLIGALKDVVPNEATFQDTLDKLDFKDWLRKYDFLQLHEKYHAESAPVNAVYDLVFSRGKDFGFGAGSCFYDTLLMLFNFRGHIFYKMAGGMGDVIFAPLYLWLKDLHGVKFEFLHDLTNVRLSSDKKRIEALEFGAKLARGSDFDPIVAVVCKDDHGNEVSLPCWPSSSSSSVFTSSFVSRDEFDHVVLAIPVGAIKERNQLGVSRCQELFVDEKFARMANNMVTRGTRAVQLWFDAPLSGLEWKSLPTKPALGPVLGSYAPDFKHNSWADMSQVIPRETWPEEQGRPRVQNIAYLCDVLDGAPRDQAEANELVRNEGIEFLEKAAGGLWPAFKKPAAWQLLRDPQNRTGKDRFDAQYWRANVDGSEQYVTGAPGTSELRLDPHGTEFDNLFLAGDWVKTPLNAGCVEGAAMGGRIAGERLIKHALDADPLVTTAAAAAGAAFITRDADLPLLQPVVMNKVDIHGYVFGADTSVLKETLRKTFEPLGITAKTLPAVVVTSVMANEIRSDVDPNAGYMVEAELGFWLAVRLKWEGGSSIGFYLPYLFVDNPAAWQAGRDIYGFNKVLGQFHYANPGDVDPTKVEAQVLTTLSANSKVDWKSVAEIERQANITKEAKWTSAFDMLRGLGAELFLQQPDARIDLNPADFGIPAFPLFFLKQQRAPGNGALTDLRSAITAHVQIADGSISGGWLRGARDSVRMKLKPHATLDIAKNLGLASDAKPLFGFYAHFDATVLRGKPFGAGL